MAYSVRSKKSGKTYHLHSKEVTLKGNRKQRIYYFAGAVTPATALNAPCRQGHRNWKNRQQDPGTSETRSSGVASSIPG